MNFIFLFKFVINNPFLNQLKDHTMSYMLLCALPEEVVNVIYDFKKMNAANVIGNYFKMAKQRHLVFIELSFYTIQDIYTNSIYSTPSNCTSETDKVIQDIYNNLTIMYNSHYSRMNYLRYDWANVLGNLSRILMYYYNRLAFSDCLKKKNINYKYLKASIQLWFKLCQKYNLYLVLCYMQSAKKVNRNMKAINLRTIKNFSEFRVSPLVTFYNTAEADIISLERGMMPHHKVLRLNAFDRSIY